MIAYFRHSVVTLAGLVIVFYVTQSDGQHDIRCRAFLPRDAMRKCSRPMSVRPPVTFVYCIRRIKDIVKLLFRPGSTIILVVFRAHVPNCKGNRFSADDKYTARWENL